MKRTASFINWFYSGSLILALLAPSAWADRDQDTNANDGLNVSTSLKHRVIIPQIIYLRIGSADMGVVDEINFDLSNGLPPGTSSYSGSGNPLGNSTPVAATNNGTLVVDVRANIGTVTLKCQVDNTSGLSDGSGHFIAFDEIGITSDETAFPAPTLSNAPSSVDIAGNFHGGRVVNRQANWTYSYKNQTIPVAGTYTGRVTYVASAP